MSNVSVRQAVLADLASLTPLFDRYRQFQGQTSEPATAHSFLQARFENTESLVLIAEVQGMAVGFAQLFPSFSSISLKRVLILNDLFVAEHCRRKGVAAALLHAIESHARSIEAVRVTLNVAKENSTAQALYEAHGWKRDAVFFMYHRDPRSSGSET